MFAFKQYLVLQENIDALLAEQWSPGDTASYRGGSSRTDAETGRLNRRISTDGADYMDNTSSMRILGSHKPKQGDVVLIQDQSGNYTPGVVTNVDKDNATIVNRKANLSAIRPIAGLSIAPSSMRQNLNLGSSNVDRTVWLYAA